MKQCQACQITGTDDCSLIYDVYLCDQDGFELELTICHLCHAMIKSYMPSTGDKSEDLR